MELRKAKRYRLGASAFYWWRQADGALQEAQGVTRDISDRGIYVLSKVPPPLGGHIEIDVHMPTLRGTDRSARLHGEGKVLRVSAEGFAAELVFQTETSAGSFFGAGEPIQ